MGNGSRSHHLLKHALPDVDVKEYFGSIEPKEIMREINRLGQRELQAGGKALAPARKQGSAVADAVCVLQARFRAVYGTQTFSNNNNWLRRKLLEGVLHHLSLYLNDRLLVAHFALCCCTMCCQHILGDDLCNWGFRNFVGVLSLPGTHLSKTHICTPNGG